MDKSAKDDDPEKENYFSFLMFYEMLPRQGGAV